MRRLAALAIVAVFVVAGCKEKDKGEEDKTGDCGPAPTAAASLPALPSAFPMPDHATITSSQKAGPSTIVEGSFEGDLDAAFEAFRDGFDAGRFTVASSEKEEDDAEVNFSGAGTSGQVKLTVPCEGRTDFAITIRPG